MSAPIWAVGLMTGTVLDGNIDVALLKTDGESIEQFGAYTLAPYPQDIRDTLEETLAEARRWNFDGPDPAIFAKAEEMLTRAQSKRIASSVAAAMAAGKNRWCSRIEAMRSRVARERSRCCTLVTALWPRRWSRSQAEPHWNGIAAEQPIRAAPGEQADDLRRHHRQQIATAHLQRHVIDMRHPWSCPERQNGGEGGIGHRRHA